MPLIFFEWRPRERSLAIAAFATVAGTIVALSTHVTALFNNC
jgi:hypothetical protein